MGMMFQELVLLVLGLLQPTGLLTAFVGSYTRWSTVLVRGGLLAFFAGFAGMAAYAKLVGLL